MNLLLFRREDARFDTPDGHTGELIVRDATLHHLTGVLRASPGESVRVGELGGLTGQACIEQINSDAATLRFALDTPPPPAIPLTLVLALPRPKMLRRILQATTTMGIKELWLINSARVEKSYWQTPFLSETAIDDNLRLGLEQARDTILPQVHLRPRFKPFVEDELPALLAGRQGLVAHPAPDAAPCPRALTGPAVLAIGPEGGFIPYEIDKLNEAGMQTVTLGPRILRVDTAVTFLSARLY